MTHEVDEQRNGDAHHVERQLHDRLALEREHHHDREEQCDERDGLIRGMKTLLVPVLALEPRAAPKRVSHPARNGMPR